MTWQDLSAQVAEEFEQYAFEDVLDVLKSSRKGLFVYTIKDEGLRIGDARAARGGSDIVEQVVAVAATRVRWTSTELAALVPGSSHVQCGVALSKQPEWRKTSSAVWLSSEQRYVCRYYWINDGAILRFFSAFESVILDHEYVKRMLGVDPSTVTRLLRRHGWQRSSKRIKQNGRRKYVWISPRSTQTEKAAA